MFTWIRNINIPQYNSLMGENADVIQNIGDYSEVMFDDRGIAIWVQCGYWNGWPNKLTKLLHRFI